MITIIVLLILAGISIVQLTGNGLFDKSKQAKEKSENAQEYEKDQIAKYSNEIDSYINNDRANTTNERYGFDETTGFYYQIFSNGFCMIWRNYVVQDTVSAQSFTFPYEFENQPSVQITKTSANSTNNNIVARDLTTTSVGVDTNYGTTNKCSFSITICGKLK